MWEGGGERRGVMLLQGGFEVTCGGGGGGGGGADRNIHHKWARSIGPTETFLTNGLGP